MKTENNVITLYNDEFEEAIIQYLVSRGFNDDSLRLSNFEINNEKNENLSTKFFRVDIKNYYEEKNEN